MQMGKTEELISSNKKRVVFTLLSFFSIYLIAYLIDPFSSYWKDYFRRSAVEVAVDWGGTLLCCLLISELSIFVHNRLNRILSWTEKSTRRLLVEVVINLVSALAITLIINYYLPGNCSEHETPSRAYSIEETRGFIQWVTISVMIALLIMSINIGIYFITNWKNEIVRATELNQVVLEAELQSLKQQIDPHFVFNNLSVLSELILKDQQLGYEYAENFSRIYRYLLVNSKKNVISLHEELKFLDSYIFLIENRFGGGVVFDIKVDPLKHNAQLPPLTLQLLVENALKHNQTSKKQPLNVKVYTTSHQELVVENAIIPMETISNSSGIGISNILQRYSLLSSLQPEIINDGTLFKVVLPLLE